MRRDADHIVALTLRIGAYAAFALIVCGLLARATGMPLAERLTWAGVLLLMATPLLRIVVALVMFLRERDWRYVWVSLGVLAIVLASSWWGVTH